MSYQLGRLREIAAAEQLRKSIEQANAYADAHAGDQFPPEGCVFVQDWDGDWHIGADKPARCGDEGDYTRGNWRHTRHYLPAGYAVCVDCEAAP